MQLYINQLVEDIHKATWNLKAPHKLWEESEADPDNELELEDMSFIEQFYMGKEQPIAEITGIDAELLPPPGKLTVDQRSQLAVELEKLLEYFHFRLNFPEGYPIELRYPFIRDFWSEQHIALSFGENQVELCDFEEENCPFLGYCNFCVEITEQMDTEDEPDESEIFDFDIPDLLPGDEQFAAWEKDRDNFNPMQDNSVDPVEDEHAYHEEINGFYDDNGDKIEPDTVPVPGLCLVCKSHQADDWDENLLCMMNRFDQRNNDNFECGAFQPL